MGQFYTNFTNNKLLYDNTFSLVKYEVGQVYRKTIGMIYALPVAKQCKILGIAINYNIKINIKLHLVTQRTCHSLPKEIEHSQGEDNPTKNSASTAKIILTNFISACREKPATILKNLKKKKTM